MTHDPPVLVDRNLLRPECRWEVVRLIRESDAPNGVKRAVYLRWFLAVQTPYRAEDLDDVITTRPIACPRAEEPR